MTPKVSVITPTKNRERLLAETLDSVGAQTFPDWEHIVVDDGSDDGTAEMMAQRRADDPRVRFLRNADRPGANVCRNIGVRAAEAPFVVFLDSDDVLAPGCLERRVQVMERNLDFDFATFQSGIFVKELGDYQNGRVLDDQLIGDDLARFLCFQAPWIITAPIWRRDSLLRIGLFDESLLSWQDIELHVRALCAGCRYVRFPEVDHHIRWQFEDTKVSVEQRRSPRHLDAAVGVIEHLEAHVRRGPGMDLPRDRGLCSLYFFLAECWIARGAPGRALDTWLKITDREIGSAALYRTGAVLLMLKHLRVPLVDRLIRKWKGQVRFRINPEVVAA